MANPLLSKSDLPFEAVPFDRLKTEHYLPALEDAVAFAKKAVEQIKANGEEPTFPNTLVALEEALAPAYQVAYVYHNLRAADGDPAMQALAKQIMPKLVELESDVNLDEELFERVQAVYQAAKTAGLDPERTRLTEKYYLDFKRNGATLGPEAKKSLREIDEELSTLGPQFAENVLNATNGFELVIEDESELSGLPESAVEAAAETARERGKAGAWVFTLQAPSTIPFMNYADHREHRRTLWLAYASRAFGGDHDNRELVKRIAVLRHKRAVLLGYESHAHFQMEERMAGHPKAVDAFLDRLLKVARPAAERELKELEAFKEEKTGDPKIEQWDFRYWSEKLKADRYDFDPELLRPYFELSRVLEGAFETAKKLYGLCFVPAKGVPAYHPDVQVFEVRSEEDAYLGLLYADFFPRDTKSAGAWCTRFRSQWVSEDGTDERPHVSIVCNFTKPTPDKPSLLTYDEVKTLFHEFGHGLHSLLSHCHFRSLSCTNVYRDFVELPSQILENWVKEASGLDLFAHHFETGEPLPRELLEKMKRAERFQAGSALLRQLRYGMLDMAWYGADPSHVSDVDDFETRAVAEAEVLPTTRGTGSSCWFQHIFAGGYSAGYYGYKWAEVLDADAFEAFKEKGLFDRQVAARFRDEILARGGTAHPMELYKRFRGREPDPDALLRRIGLA